MATFTNIIKNTVSQFADLVKRLKAYLLQENGYHLLLEDGGNILIDRGIEFSNTTKNNSTFVNNSKNNSIFTNTSKNSSSFTNQTKN